MMGWRSDSKPFKPLPLLNTGSTSQNQVRCPNPMPPNHAEKGRVSESEISKPIGPFKSKRSLVVPQAIHITCKGDQRSESQNYPKPFKTIIGDGAKPSRLSKSFKPVKHSKPLKLSKLFNHSKSFRIFRI